MKKFIFYSFVFLSAYVFSVYPQDLNKEMDNYLGQGFDRLSHKDLSSAADSFSSAGDIAVKTQNLHGCIDAAMGLVAVREYDKARQIIITAQDIMGDTGGDMRQRIALASAIAVIPQIQRFALMPEFHLDRAQDMAKSAQNWYALLEIAKTHAYLGNKDKTQSALAEAEIILLSRNIEQGYDSIALIYDKIDMPRKAEQLREAKNKVLPANRQNQKQIELDAKQKKWLYEYDNYFQFIDCFDATDFSGKGIYKWANLMLRNYCLENGVYVRIDN